MQQLDFAIQIQVQIVKEDIVKMIHEMDLVPAAPVKVLDLLIYMRLVMRFEMWDAGKRAYFEGYRQHPYLNIDLSKVIDILVSEKQIEVLNELSGTDRIVSGCIQGDNKAFEEMLMSNINKVFRVMPNFNLPPSDTGYTIPEEIYRALPPVLLSTVLEVNEAYLHGLNIACGMLLRRLLEAAIILKFTQENRTSEIRDASGGIRRLSELIPRVFNIQGLNFPPELRRRIQDIKWLGDKGAHYFDLEIFRQDVKQNLTNVRDFLRELKLKQ